MNHNQDIDDGLDDYLETVTRLQDQETFAQNPELFSGDLGQVGEGDPFVCTVIHSLQLNGGRHLRRAAPYCYDGGVVLLEGGLVRGGPARVKISWDEHQWDAEIENLT